MIRAAMQHAMRSPLQSAMDRMGSAVWTPATLFAASEQGVWYDPSDFSTMFQDSAGTTPVTAVGQPVGRILDKSGRGNHATQATATARPVLSARVNLLTKTEDFADAVWVPRNTTLSANTVLAPDGTLSASTVIATATTSDHWRYQAVGSFPTGTVLTKSVYVKAAGYGWAVLREDDVAVVKLWVNLSTGAIGTVEAGLAGVSSVPAGNGWWRISYTRTAAATSAKYLQVGSAPSNGVENFLGDGVSGVSVWHPQVETGPVATPYQRVNTASDYDTVGFPHYLAFDGVDDSMATASINFTATDKMTSVFGALHANTSVAFIYSGGSTDSLGTSSTEVTVRDTSSTDVVGRTANSAKSQRRFTAVHNAPYVATIQFDISQPTTASEQLGRINGVVNAGVDLVTGNDTGNFASAPLRLGGRAGGGFALNGRIYSLIVRGALSDAAQIAAAEAYVNSKTAAY